MYCVGYFFYTEFVRSFLKYFSSHDTTVPSGPRPPHYLGFAITLRHTHAFSRTTLDEWSVRRRDLYRTKQNTNNRQPRPCPVRDLNPQSRQQAATDRAVTGIGLTDLYSSSNVTGMIKSRRVRWARNVA